MKNLEVDAVLYWKSQFNTDTSAQPTSKGGHQQEQLILIDIRFCGYGAYWLTLTVKICQL